MTYAYALASCLAGAAAWMACTWSMIRIVEWLGRRRAERERAFKRRLRQVSGWPV